MSEPKSHPPREGVDWNFKEKYKKMSNISHPPREGVDWNERLFSSTILFRRSPSTRGCGLKQFHVLLFGLIFLSPSTRGCGLKLLVFLAHNHRWWVTLHARVWIETVNTMYPKSSGWSPSTRGCGLKPIYIDDVPLPGGHPPREGVDWNIWYIIAYLCYISHPPREGVDWNRKFLSLISTAFCHPPREGVDWNTKFLSV